MLTDELTSIFVQIEVYRMEIEFNKPLYLSGRHKHGRNMYRDESSDDEPSVDSQVYKNP